jgi:NAD(P)-dependent dehydrogenase (short-subunit alcohol dehydrogenase family)
MAPFPSFTKQWHTTSYQAISPSRPELSLKGKVILITGGGAGIGARVTRSFAEAGASHIAILGRRQANLDATASEVSAAFPATKIHTYTADITDKDAVDTVFKEYSTAAGKIDILVSNAAAGDFDPSIKDVDAAKWFSIVETNIKGPLLLTQAFLAGYGKEDGLIINVTSGLSFLFGPGVSAYAVSKEAGVRFFQILGLENPKLRIMSVQPGVIETEMNKRGTIPAMDDSKFLFPLRSRFETGRKRLLTKL